MCYIWQNPTIPQEEITPTLLSKLPNGFDNVNITGGEPTLRVDLLEICDVLYPKARTLEISTNGLKPHLLIPIVKKNIPI
jgi:molybdenum cofactor biosynthesis enzyme MoaA